MHDVKTGATSRFALRAVQLDLARQHETVAFIKEYVDFIAEHGHNALFLYLEWAVRTDSFPYPDPKESYSPDEMREIVNHAAGKGVDVIPGLALFGHAELFLKHPELAHCAELADGRSGRFGDAKLALCLSSPEVKERTARYLEEMAAIFPSQYIHVGGDEIWDVGFCDRCAARSQDFAGEQRLYLNHVVHCHQVVAGRLGRRMMLWDDMFELYEDILPEVPRDVIMVNWQYQADASVHSGHFANQMEKDFLGEYDRLGFDYLLAPADYLSSNIRTLTEQAEGRGRLLGGLLTSWGKSETLAYKSFPLIAYAGKLWGEPPQADAFAVFRRAAAACCGLDDALFAAALWSAYEGRIQTQWSSLNRRWFVCAKDGFDHAALARYRLERTALAGFADKVRTRTGRLVLEDLLRWYDCVLAELAAALALSRVVRGHDAAAAVEAAAQDLDRIAERSDSAWEASRPGITPNRIRAYASGVAASAREMSGKLNAGNWLRVRFCLPDAYSAARTVISLRHGGETQELVSGVFKHMRSTSAFYECFFPLPDARAPEAVLFSVTGYGGQGLCYVEAKVQGGSFVPAAVGKVEGVVDSPDSILDNDCKWAFLGERDTRRAFRGRDARRHQLEVALAEK